MSLWKELDDPVTDEAWPAFLVLLHASHTAGSLLDAFDERTSQRGQGAPSDVDYDLLRAMLVFACAGLDSMIKHLIEEALPAAINHLEGAQKRFEEFVQRKLNQDDKRTWLGKVLTTPDPRNRLVEEFVADLVAGSLQSRDKILSMGALFGLGMKDLIDNPQSLNEVFHARNQIGHEMDMDLTGQQRRSRRPRRRDETVALAELVLECGANFLKGADVALANAQKRQ